MKPEKPDATEKGVRFGCGFLVGSLTLGTALLRGIHAPVLPGWYFLATAGGALATGLLATRFGNGLYEKVAAFLRWW